MFACLASNHYRNYYWLSINWTVRKKKHSEFVSKYKHCVSWTFDWSPCSAAYMLQWIGSVLVQIMACRLFGPKSLSKPMLGYLLSIGFLRNKLQGNFDQNIKFFIQEIALENIVCEMTAILSRGRWVKIVPTIFCAGLGVLTISVFASLATWSVTFVQTTPALGTRLKSTFYNMQ